MQTSQAAAQLQMHSSDACLVHQVLLTDLAGLQAVEAYQHAQRLEPDDQQLQQACHRAQIAQAKMAADRKHKFKARPPDVSVGAAKKPRTGAAPGSKSALSFAEDDEDE